MQHTANVARTQITSLSGHLEDLDAVLGARGEKRVIPQRVDDLLPALCLEEAVAVEVGGGTRRPAVRLDDEAVQHRRTDVDQAIAPALEPLRPAFVGGVRRGRRALVEEDEGRHLRYSFPVACDGLPLTDERRSTRRTSNRTNLSRPICRGRSRAYSARAMSDSVTVPAAAAPLDAAGTTGLSR